MSLGLLLGGVLTDLISWRVKGYSALAAGIAFFPMIVVNFAVAVATTQLTCRIGNGLLLAAGLAATTAGMLWLSRLDADSSYLTARQPKTEWVMHCAPSRPPGSDPQSRTTQLDWSATGPLHRHESEDLDGRQPGRQVRGSGGDR